MKYDVHVEAHHGGEASRFVLEQFEPLAENDYIRRDGVTYKVQRVLPYHVSESDEFDAKVEAVWSGGPGEASVQT